MKVTDDQLEQAMKNGYLAHRRACLMAGVTEQEFDAIFAPSFMYRVKRYIRNLFS